MTEACPLCANPKMEVFLERLGVPIVQNFPFATAEAARSIPRGDLRLACCAACGFIANLKFSESLLQYGAGYENDQTFSPLFEDYVAGLATRIVEGHAVQGKHVIEVGCGQGKFLRTVCARGHNTGAGFDPAYVGPDAVDDGNVRFVRDYYGARFADEPADAVVCRHVIEHVPSPLHLLGAVRAALTNAPDAALFFETPDVDWILDGTVIQDFFYEHCSYFSAESMRFAFVEAGFSNIRVERIFGGQYLWLSGSSRHRAEPRAMPVGSAARTLERARTFGRNATERASRLRTQVDGFLENGRVAVWGAGAKGVTFLNQLDPGAQLIDCVVDINPRKQHRFVPGTGHPIVSPSDLGPRRVATVIAMNPNYVEEIRVDVAAAGGGVVVVSESAL